MVFEFLTDIQVFILITMVIVFFIAGIIVSFFILQKLLWPFRVTILEKIPNSNNYGVTRGDKARVIPFGDSGEEIYYLKKTKKYRKGYGKMIGRKRIAWAIGDDGYWYNVTFGDLNTKLLEVGVIPVDRDMRFSSSSLRKGIDSRWKSKTFFEKWGVTITLGILIFGMIVQGAVVWFNLDKQSEVAKINADVLRTTNDVMDTMNNVINKLELLQGGSGFVPVENG